MPGDAGLVPSALPWQWHCGTVALVPGERLLCRAGWVREQEQSRAHTMCVLRQPPSELREESIQGNSGILTEAGVTPQMHC